MPTLIGPRSRVTVAEQSKIIAAVKAGRGAQSIAAELGRPKVTIEAWIAKLRKRGAIKP